MADDSTIKINPSKKSELEFEVTIQGLDKSNIPLVRFVIIDVEQCDYMFKCSKAGDEQGKWVVKLPELTHLKQKTYKFCVEVIVDGYWFMPAEGTLSLIADPAVKFQTTATKPTVKTSFTVKQEPEPKKEEKPTKSVIKEGSGSGGGEITGQYAPTNDLLRKEMPPKQSTRKTAQAEVYDQDINKAELDSISSSFTPGAGTDPPPQEDGKDDEDDENREDDLVGPDPSEPFDAKSVAENIIKGAFGTLTKTAGKKGSLFKRTLDGKPIVEGWKDPEVEADKAEKAKRVKQILDL